MIGITSAVRGLRVLTSHLVTKSLPTVRQASNGPGQAKCVRGACLKDKLEGQLVLTGMINDCLGNFLAKTSY